jgi:hypothetical protein
MLIRQFAAAVFLAMSWPTAIHAEANFGLSAQPRETQLRRAEQSKMLRQLKAQLAQFPREPPPSVGETLEVRERRDKREKLDALVLEIEQRMADEKDHRPLPAKVRTPYEAYYGRLKARIESEANAAPPRRDGGTLNGAAVVTLTIGAAGEIEALNVDRATSAEFSEYIRALLRRLAPFEALSAEMRKRADRVVISAPLSYKVD